MGPERPGVLNRIRYVTANESGAEGTVAALPITLIYRASKTVRRLNSSTTSQDAMVTLQSLYSRIMSMLCLTYATDCCSDHEFVESLPLMLDPSFSLSIELTFTGSHWSTDWQSIIPSLNYSMLKII